MFDKKGCKILHDTYWSASGWRVNPQVSPDDFKYAKETGFMFEPVSLSHNKIVDLVRSSYSKVNLSDVVNGFLASLSTRRLDLRSALGSYAIARHFPKHRFKGKVTCSICGEIRKRHKSIDLSRLNFERYKWGGVNHWSPVYIAFDLEQFSITDIPGPSGDDIYIMSEIIEKAREQSPESRPSVLEKSLSAVLKSTTEERRILLQILGYCGILQPAGYDGFFDGYVNYHDRLDRPVYKIDWTYPLSWWQGKHGVNEQALKFYFPEVWKLSFSG